MMLSVLFAVAEKTEQESGGFALSGNPFEDPIFSLSYFLAHYCSTRKDRYMIDP